MRFWSVIAVLSLSATVGFAETPSPKDVEIKPLMEPQKIAADSKQSSSATGLSVPLTVFAFGTLVLAPATP